MEWCVSCGQPLTEVQHVSGLYGAAPGQLLCPVCADFEEQQIEQAGTNYVPQLLSSYRIDACIKPGAIHVQ